MKKLTGSLKKLKHELRLIVKRARQVWRLVPRRHKLALGGAMLLIAFTSLASTLIPFLLGRLMDALYQGTEGNPGPNQVYQSALCYLGLIGCVYLLREAVNVGRRYLVENTSTRIDRDMTVRLISHLHKVDLSTFTHEKLGALNGRISRSVDGYVRFLRLNFLDFCPALFTCAFALAASLSKEPRLALLMLGVIPASLLLTVWQLGSQKHVRLKLLRSREEMDGTVIEQLSGLDYVRAANTHGQEIRRVARTAEKRRAKEIRHHFQMSLFGCAKALNEGLFHILVLGYAVFLVSRGTLSVGDVLTFSMYFMNVMSPLSEVHRVLDEAHESSLRVGDLLELLAEPTDRSFTPIQSRPPQVTVRAPLVEIEDLSVEYRLPDSRSRRALDGIHMSIKHGETIGIAGRSGCGKSTWLKVLLRLTHPCGGSVRVGGVPLESVSRESIGDLIGYVGQSPFIFAGTIAENIAYGVENATAEAIRKAAEMACIHDEILAMPGWYDAPVAERGQNLSGGQRQRLALARLFLKNPPILILDEGTSALDAISERSVQRALAAARADRTVILVAHRLSTLLDTDRIFVFDQGRIVEDGSFADLVGRNGVFAELLRNTQEGVKTPLGPAVHLELGPAAMPA